MTDTASPRTGPARAASLFRARAVAVALTRDLVPARGETVTVEAPWTGAPLVDVTRATVRDVDAAEAEARAAQSAWATTPFRQRRAILLRAHDSFLARRREVVDLLQWETGKARGTAFEEFFSAASTLRHTAVTAASVLAPRTRGGIVPGLTRARVDLQPKGLVSVVTPWNFPLSLSAMDVIPAIAAGNAVLHKLDERTLLSALLLRRCLVRAGLPAQLWQVVAGAPDPIGNAVVDAGDHVAFTGSTAAGARIAERAAPRIASVSLELGGKNPMIVLDDVDPVRAARQAVNACFASTGQTCVAIERIYVLRPVAGRFLAEFQRVTSTLVIGGRLDYTADIGSLSGAAQLARVDAHVRDAKAKGARVLTGGRARGDLGPYFYEPTILTAVAGEMDCVTEETFGPVVAVHVVDSVEEAIAAANDSDYGLNAAVLCGSTSRGHRVARRLVAGTVNINEGYRTTIGAVGLPQGGMRRSGLGRRNGPEGILRFVQPRAISAPSALLPLPDSGAAAARMESLFVAALVALKTLRLP